MSRSVCFVDIENARETKRLWSGNKRQQKKLRNKIRKMLRLLVESEDITRLVCSMDLGIGIYAAEEILEMKKKNPDIWLECVIPYENYCEKWSEEDRKAFHSIWQQCDERTCYQSIYTEGCIREAYRKTIAYSWALVPHWLGTPREMGMLVAEAIQMGKPVFVFDMYSI